MRTRKTNMVRASPRSRAPVRNDSHQRNGESSTPTSSSFLNRLLPLASSATSRTDDVHDDSEESTLDRTQERLNAEYGLDEEDGTGGRADFGMEREEGDDWDVDADHDEEEEEEEEEGEDGERGDDYDSPLATPRSKRGLVGSSTPRSSTSTNRSPAVSSVARSKTNKAGRTPRQQQRKLPTWMIDPSLPGFVRPTAADAYFLAASRPKRKRVEEEPVEEETRGKEGEMLFGTPHRSGKRPTVQAGPGGDVVVKHAEQLMTLEDRRQALQTHHRARYAEWASLLMSARQNLIFFGHGSKREMLQEFMVSTLQPRGHCISVNGLYPGLKIRDVLVEIAITFPGVEKCPVPDLLTRGIDKLAQKIYTYFLPAAAIPSAASTKTSKRGDLPAFETSSKPLFLLLHNIDGPGIRNERSIEILSLFASCPGIYLITSFDHVHTPILFSTTLNNTPKHQFKEGGWTGMPPPTRGFNWAWIHTSTYAPYTLEMEYVRQHAAYAGKLLAGDQDLPGMHGGGSSGDVTEEGALRILASVPPMAKRLFKLLATKQLAAIPADPRLLKAFPVATAAAAPPFAIDSEILQTLAKDKFIAREEERYNTQLMEYKDHGVIVEHTLDAEGRPGRWLWIPFSKEVLGRILNTLEDVEG
ncbi:hypothetical protein QFC22_003853 [Naganishia vaughanmartiniae]|uniref:Uncharacterized protein n=1 Tax=Naganishia vaughanmartiniae TaxID=1424756 RepID=A0ACC2X4D0_9TREE|nr:hypothetical protein QFC22_003853 [Naganishia vaughanmartiniae]